MARRRALPAGFERSSVTEGAAPWAKLLKSSSRNAVVKIPMRREDESWLEEMNTEFWLEEMADFTPDEAAPAGRKHSRKPDLTMKIRIYMKRSGAWHMMSSGVYAGHGQSKTAFCLSPQTNGILKVAREKEK